MRKSKANFLGVIYILLVAVSVAHAFFAPPVISYGVTVSGHHLVSCVRHNEPQSGAEKILSFKLLKNRVRYINGECSFSPSPLTIFLAPLFFTEDRYTVPSFTFPSASHHYAYTLRGPPSPSV